LMKCAALGLTVFTRQPKIFERMVTVVAFVILSSGHESPDRGMVQKGR
jgi:hypothetical protein